VGVAAPALPWLVADIGGTNARFGLVRAPRGAVEDIRAVRCADFATPQAAAQAYLDDLSAAGRSAAPRRAAFALATPIDSDTVKMTNSNWVIARREVTAALGLERLHLVNDFEALALALPHLADDDVVAIGPGQPDKRLPMAVVGPGTGLGVALCVPTGGGWVAIAAEGGHVTMAAADDFEGEVLRHARREFPHVSAERLLSGIGLPVLHRAVAAVRGEVAETLTAEEISQRAFGRGGDTTDPCCLATLDTFCAMLGTLAGNLALTGGARGGVFIAGGIAQKLGDYFIRSRFRARFEAKGRFQGYLSTISTRLIVAPYVALQGAAQAVEQELGAG